MPSTLIAEVTARRSLPPPSTRRALRLAAGLSYGRIAQELGVSDSTVRRWELGLFEPRGESLLAYVELLDQLRVAA